MKSGVTSIQKSRKSSQNFFKKGKGKDQEDDEAPEKTDKKSDNYEFYQETFRISKISDMKSFKQIICKYWAIEPRKFDFYDDNGEKLDEEEFGRQDQLEKIMETVMVKELKDKDLYPPGPRQVLLYIGDENFSKNFKAMMDKRRQKLDEEKKERKKQGLQEDDEDEGKKVEEDNAVDHNQEFLKQFPALSSHYMNNKQLFNKHKIWPPNQKKKEDAKIRTGFDIKQGNWLPPTCCSLVVNFIQFQLTLSSILMYKGDARAYWLPELIRSDLEPQFKSMQNMNEFWNFTKEGLGNYLFDDKELFNPGTNQVDLDLLTQYDNDNKSTRLKGRIFVGPMRMLSKRV